MVDITEGWQKLDGKEAISRRWKFNDFASSYNFVQKVSELAEDRNHHPDIRFGWGYCELTLTTHDAGGLTQKDVELAELYNTMN